MNSEFSNIVKKGKESLNRLEKEGEILFLSVERIPKPSPISDIVYYLTEETENCVQELYNNDLLLDILKAINMSVELSK